MDWSKKPSFEWAILGGRPGVEVKRGKDLAIICNLKHKQPLMYLDRTVGGDIGWSSTFAKPMEDVVEPLLLPGIRGGV